MSAETIGPTAADADAAPLDLLLTDAALGVLNRVNPSGSGLAVTAVLDENPYPADTVVSDEQMTDLEARALTRHAFRGDWNYTLLPAWRPARPPAPDPRPHRTTPPGPPSCTPWPARP